MNKNQPSKQSQFQLQWRQPEGRWKRQGAHPHLIQIGLGIYEGGTLKDEEQLDHRGFTPWHYWALSPTPEKNITFLKDQVGPGHSNSISKDKIHPLHILLFLNKEEATKLWMQHFKTPKKDLTTHFGDSILHCSAWSGNLNLVELSLNKIQKDFINHLNDAHLTPLEISIHLGCIKTVETLLESGADPSVLDQNEKTALHHAASNGDIQLFELLENYGADRYQPDRGGRTPEVILNGKNRKNTSDVKAIRDFWHRKKEKIYNW